MGKIFCIIGKSATGKDTVYKRILDIFGEIIAADKGELFLKGQSEATNISGRSMRLGTICTYTTRPIRSGEQEGKEYHFVDIPTFEKLKADGKVIESRVYHTVYGDWFYFTADDGQIQLKEQDYLLIMTLEGYISLANYYGNDKVVPIYIEVEDGLRLARALERERAQITPKYAELCRRFLADAEDFAEEKLAEIEGLIRIENIDLDECVKKTCDVISDYIKAEV